jgi:hypothetical protein
MVRSHELKDKGYEVQHNGQCITIFSAPNYWYVFNRGIFGDRLFSSSLLLYIGFIFLSISDQMNNLGAFINLRNDLIPKFVTFSAKVCLVFEFSSSKTDRLNKGSQ